ncbi:hypothetical protein SLS58_006914 [Diplodia intermedia]|uniref:Uncharacterized protein n=1 Tax=Diplodia intermedia TaxID=856260 RepID=A0ABR3TLN0_9PEZI
MAESLPPEPPDFIHLVDPSYFDPDPIEPFRLLDLPRELRDMIYERMFIRNTVFITQGECWEPGQKKRINHPRWSWQLHSRQIRRTTFLNPPADYWSYDDPHLTDVEPSGNVNVFLSNRQIYQEASAVYYKNNFCFMDEFSVPACYTFLMDRTPHALKHLKHITLHITAWYDGDSMGSEMNSQDMFDLVGFINRNLSLESLSLELQGWPPDVRSATWDWRPPGFMFARDKMSWIGALLELTPVPDLSIAISADDRGPPERLAAFVHLLRSQLLQNGEGLGSRNIKAYIPHAGRWCLRTEADGSNIVKGFKRKTTDRGLRALSHDDDKGRSLAKPPQRAAPLWEGAVAKRVARGEEREAAREAVREAAADEHRYGNDDSDVSDYDASDGSDGDSLNSLELDDDDVEAVRDEAYFMFFRDIPDRIWRHKDKRYRGGASTGAEDSA